MRQINKMGKLWKRLIKNISEGIAKSVIVVDVIKLMWDCHTEPRTLEMSKQDKKTETTDGYATFKRQKLKR